MLDNNAAFLSKNIYCRVFSPNAYIAEGQTFCQLGKKKFFKDIVQSKKRGV
jgi:hypothetical protein